MTEKKDMSRTVMTAWICGTLALIAFAAIMIFAMQPDPNDRFAECRGTFGGYDAKCKAEVAARRLRGY